MRDDYYLAKMKQAGATDQDIAAKLGLSPEEVRRIWADMIRLKDNLEESGYLKLSEQFNLLCAQYNLVGSSLKFVAGAFANAYTPSELREIIAACPKDRDLADYLMGKCIPLKPYLAVQSPVEDMNATLSAQNN